MQKVTNGRFTNAHQSKPAYYVYQFHENYKLQTTQAADFSFWELR